MSHAMDGYTQRGNLIILINMGDFSHHVTFIPIFIFTCKL